MHPVVGQPGQVRRADVQDGVPDVPFAGRGLQPDVEPADRPGTVGRPAVGEPVALGPHRIRGQRHGGTPGQVAEGFQAGGVAEGERAGEGLRASLAPAQRGQRRHGPCLGGDQLLDGRGEDRMRADLHDVRDAVRQRAAHGVGEQHRAAQVRRPVGRVHPGAVDRLGVHRGEQLQGARPRGGLRERVQQVVAQRGHLGAVRGVVDVDELAVSAVRLQPLPQREYRVTVPGQHAGRRPVVRGQRDRVPVRTDGREGGVAVEVHRHHAPVPAGPADDRAAPRHDQRGVLVRQRSGEHGRGDLALAVAQDDVGFHTGGPPQRGQAQ